MSKPENGDRVYSFGYSSAAIDILGSRSAGVNAQFLLDHLKPEMDVLDIGCGPGSITVGLADLVKPGKVVGIDIEPSQVAMAVDRAASIGRENCSFKVGSVYSLPLADRTFDAVFGHTILMQFRELDSVLAEVKRVLKPGGLVGFREIDIGASFFHSDASALRAVMWTLRRSILHNDGNPDIGRSLPAILANAGFEIITASATYTCSMSAKAKADMYSAMTRLWEQADFVDRAEALGWIDGAARSKIVEELKREAHDPGSFNATTYAEVVARLKP